MNSSFRNLFFCSLIGIGLFSLLNALPSSVRTQADLSIHIPRSEEWLRNQIGYVVGEKSTPSGERLGLSKNPPSPNQESGQPKAESRASESQTRGLKAAQSVSPQTEHLEPKTATDPDLWNFGSGHSPLVPLSPLRPIFTEILLTSLAVEEEGAELVGMTVQMDLPELGLTGEAILTDIRSAPAIEPPVDHLDTRQVVTATFHHSSGDVIDLVLADEHPGEQLGLSENPPCQNGGKPRAESRVGDPVPANATNTANGHSPLNTCDFPNTEHLKPKTLGEAETEPIGTTSNHPFWSVDRQEFVQAGSLEIGERLQTLSGDVKVVQQKLPRPGPQPVFNLEVHNEHVYFVGEDGVLVHNSGPYGSGRARIGHSALTEGDIDQVAFANVRSRSGDGLDGHELWQSANTRETFLSGGGRTGRYGKRNPAIYLTESNHAVVNGIQDRLIPNASLQTPLENISSNISVLRQAQRAGVPITDRQIKDLAKRAVRFYQRSLDAGLLK